MEYDAAVILELRLQVQVNDTPAPSPQHEDAKVTL